MKANKKTLMAVKHFLQNEQEYWDKDGVITEIMDEHNFLEHADMGYLDPDECAIEWGGEVQCNLDDFIKAFFDATLEKFCDVLDSFVGEDISCYFEED